MEEWKAQSKLRQAQRSLTLDSVITSLSLAALAIDLDQRTGPGAVEENLDNHVCVCGGKGSNGG